jgi:hypothetical protein
VAGAAGKVATIGKAAQAMQKAALAERVAKVQKVAGIGTIAAQNAAETFVDLIENGTPMEDAYIAAGITVPFSVVAGVLTGGGAEGAITRAMTRTGAVKTGIAQTLKASGREGAQEMGEELGQITGKAVATGEAPTPNSALKQLSVAGTLGAVMGGGVDVASQLDGFGKPAASAPNQGANPPQNQGGAAPTVALPAPAPNQVQIVQAAPVQPVKPEDRIAEIIGEDAALSERQMSLDSSPDSEIERLDILLRHDELAQEYADLNAPVSTVPSGTPVVSGQPVNSIPSDRIAQSRDQAATPAERQAIEQEMQRRGITGETNGATDQGGQVSPVAAQGIEGASADVLGSGSDSQAGVSGGVAGGSGSAGIPGGADGSVVPAGPAGAPGVTQLDEWNRPNTPEEEALLAELEATPLENWDQPARTDGTDAVVPDAGMTLLHGSGNAALSLDDIQIVRTTGQKQGKKGRTYGGFYATAENDAAQAENYARMMGGTPTIHNVRVKPGTKILNKTGDVTRLTDKYIAELVEQGYGMVVGKSPTGKTEYAIIDKGAIESVAPTKTKPATPLQESAPAPVTPRKVEESVQEQGEREFQENYAKVSGSEDLSQISDRDLIRANSFASRARSNEARKGWDGGAVNQDLIRALDTEIYAYKAELNRRNTTGDTLAAQPEQVAEEAGQAQGAEGKTEGVTKETLQDLGLYREFGGRHQYRMTDKDGTVSGGWFTSNSMDGAIEMATKAHDRMPPESRLTRAQRDAKADAEYDAESERRYGKLTTDQLRAEVDRLTGEIASLQKAGKREFNGNGGRRTSAAVSNEGARMAGEEKMRLERLIKQREASQDAEDALAGQGDIFAAANTPTPEQKAPDSAAGKPAVSQNTVFTEDAAAAARALLKKKLGQLNAGIDPEIMQAGITLAGYHIEKGARTFAAYAKAMIEDLGDAVKPYLKSWYAAVSLDPRASGFDGLDDLAAVQSSDIEAILKETGDTNEPDQRSSTDLERDSGNAGTQDGMGEEGVRNDGGRNGGLGEQGIRQPDQDAPGERGERVSGHEASVAGTQGDFSPFADSTGTEDGTAGSDLDQRSGDLGLFGQTLEPAGTEATDRVAQGGIGLIEKRQAQTKAQSVKVEPGNRANIAESLPFLLEGQKDDVAFAENRFAKPEGYGVLFTNGTGTGKTYSGLGVIKRFERQGKSNILIVVPYDKISSDWVKAGRDLKLNITGLENTQDAGKGIVITTYANMGANDALVRRKWDLIVADESHYMMQAKDGGSTNALDNLRAITMHPRGKFERHSRLYAKEIARLKKLSDKITSNNRIMNLDDTMDQMIVALRDENVKMQAETDKLTIFLREKQEQVKAEVESAQGITRTRAVFLSATPFAYEKTVDYAEGYLFNYAPEDTRGGYNFSSGSQFDRFMMQHFGYKMKYNKLNEPGPEVNRGLMQRAFNSWLKSEKVLSGRMLDVEHDYDRKFILVDSAIGAELDRAMQWIWDRAYDQANPNKEGYSMLQSSLAEKFDHLARRYLLEAIKAKEAIPIIRAHLDMGRKVVVFHDFKKGGGFNPLIFVKGDASSATDDKGKAAVQAYNTAIDAFNDEFADLIASPMWNAASPIDALSTAFPDALLFNGDVPAKKRRENATLFNEDDSGKNLIIGQSAAMKEGVSLHDTTGKHQRVLINLGLPTQPTTAIQQEGRIFRVGQASNAIFRYLNTGTNWERFAFATSVAQRASAAENLAVGEEARALMDAFIEGFEESDTYPAGHEGEGTGGKARDKAANQALTEWDRAMTLYWAQQKKTSRTKAQEGVDYFATPEPLGLKMVEWADIRDGDKALEPSAGHGAIARWLPDNINRTVVEPSGELSSRLKMVMMGDGVRLLQEQFEALDTAANKFDAIVMNPPFGSGGSTAIQHVAKAARHLNNGGRIVALIPTGPAADKKFDKWFYEEEQKAVKPLAEHPTLGPIYKGDVIETNVSWMKRGKVMKRDQSGNIWLKDNMPGESMVNHAAWNAVVERGPRTETFRPAENLYLRADIKLPQVTFERSGTRVAARVVVIEKQTDKDAAAQIQQVNRDFSDSDDIKDFFSRIKESSIPARTMPETSPAVAPAAPGKASAKPASEGKKLETDAEEVTYTTKKGKVLNGVIAKGITEAQAKEYDPYTWKKDGGFFIRMEHVKRPGEAPALSRAATPTGIALRDLKAVTARVKQSMSNLPTVHVLSSPEQLDRADASQAALYDFIEQAGAMNDVEGATHDGEIYLFASGLADEARAEHVLATHEVTHYGLRSVFGTDLDTVLQSIWANNASVRKQATALRKRLGLKSNVAAVEEVLADMEPADLVKLKGWRKLVGVVRDWLQNHGFTTLAGKLDGMLKAGVTEQQQADMLVADVVNSARDWVKGGKRAGKVGSGTALQRGFAVTGFGLRPDANGEGYDTSVPTQTGPTPSRPGLGADLPASGATVPSLDQATRRDTQIGSGSPAGAESGSSIAKLSTSNTNPDIRFSRNLANLNPLQRAKAKYRQLTSPEAIDKVLYEVQDKYIDLRRLRDHIKKIGGVITDLNDAYLGEELYHKRLAKQTEDFLDNELKPLLAGLREHSISMEDFEQFLHARHAPEANAKLAESNPNQQEIDAGQQQARAAVKALELQLQTANANGTATRAIDQALKQAREELAQWNGAQAFRGTEAERLSLSGMSDQESAALMAAIPANKRVNYDRLAGMVDTINARTLDTLQRSGLMSKADLDTWRTAYQFYVPLYRDDAHPSDTSHPIGQGFSTRGDAARRRVGSNEQVTNILSHIAMQRESALTRAEKNMVMQKLYLMAKQNPLPDYWKPDAVPMVKVQGKDGFVHTVPDPRYKDSPNILMLRVGGKDVAIEFKKHNPQAFRLAQAMKNLDVDDLHYVIPIIGKGTRWLASVNTQYNPIFGVINFIRDVQSAALNLTTTELAGSERALMKDTIQIMREVLKNYGRMPKTGRLGVEFDEFQSVGGTTGYRDLYLTPEDRANKLKDELKALDRGDVKKAAYAVAEWLSDYNEAMENAVRLAAYVAAKDKGMTKVRAASLAKNLTVNFNRKGRQTREIGALFAFFNAALQGTKRMHETLSGPAGKKIMAGGVLVGVLNTVIGMAMMGAEGDDDDDNWEKIPEFIKERAIIIPTSKEDYITIPMPLGFHFLPNIGRLATEFAMGGDDKTATKQAVSLAVVMADAFNPLGGSAPILQMAMPTVFDPLVALAQNKDWTGKPIYMENYSDLDPDPGYKLTKSTATPWSKAFTELINDVTGGTEYTPGMLSPTPDQVDYIIGQLTGGVGREIGKVAQTVESQFTGDELPPYKIPLVGRLYGNTRGTAGQATAFYENLKQANMMENEIKGRMKDGVGIDEYLAENPNALTVASKGNRYESVVRKLRTRRQDLAKRNAPKEELKAIDDQITDTMKEFNREMSAN